MTSNAGSMIKLTESNYPTWKIMMEDYLHCNDLYAPVKGDSAKPKKMSAADWKNLNRKAVATIRQWIDFSLFHHVSKETSAHQLWKKLEELNEQKVTRDKLFTLKRLVNLKYEEGNVNIGAFTDLVNQLSSMKLVIGDELQALLLLNSLPDSWEDFAVSCSNKAPNGKLSMQMVRSDILSEIMRRWTSSFIKKEPPMKKIKN